MPPKNITLGPGTLYIDGIPLEEIQEAVVECLEPEWPENTEPVIKIFKQPGEATIEATMAVRRLTLLSFLYGRKITNNWLKMHGYPMVRKVRG